MSHRIRWLSLLFMAAILLLVTPPTLARPLNPTVLAPGDLHIVAYASDNPDAFAFVTWVDITEGTEVRFTDKGWDCNGFVTGESVIRWTALEDLPAGSVRSYENGVSNTPEWTIESGSVILSVYGDQLMAFQGTVESPSLVYALDTTGGWESCDAVASKKHRHSALPTGLVDGVSAVSWAHADNFWYRPWYATSASLPVLKEWMVNRNRFIASSSKRAEYEVPASFAILEGEIGASGYTEYLPGTAPCVVLSGHDGDVFPATIADRTDGCWVDGACVWTKDCAPTDASACRAVTLNDENTQDVARRAVDAFASGGNHRCHLIISRLGRSKLDPNREIEQAAQFDPVAVQAYHEFHAFAAQATRAIQDSPSCGRGILLDFHGHAHPEGRIELGYKLSAYYLRKTDEEIDAMANSTSIRSLANTPGFSLSSILRGTDSLGSWFDTFGYPSVPSPTTPHPPEGEGYFSGGYNIDVHGSKHDGSVDGIQIEFPRHLRAEDYAAQAALLQHFGEFVLPAFLETHYGFVPPFACD